MTRYAGPTTETLMQRVRTAGGTGVNETLAMQTLSRSQRIVNAALARVVTSGTLPTFANMLLYPYRTSLTDAIDIVSVQDGGRTLFKVENLEEFFASNPTWWRETGASAYHWHQIARDLLIIHPGPTSNGSLTVVYSKLTADLSDFSAHYNTAMDLPDEDVDLALAIAEALLLLTVRQYDATAKRLEELTEMLGPYIKEAKLG